MCGAGDEHLSRSHKGDPLSWGGQQLGAVAAVYRDGRRVGEQLWIDRGKTWSRERSCILAAVLVGFMSATYLWSCYSQNSLSGSPFVDASDLSFCLVLRCFTRLEAWCNFAGRGGCGPNHWSAAFPCHCHFGIFWQFLMMFLCYLNNYWPVILYAEESEDRSHITGTSSRTSRVTSRGPGRQWSDSLSHIHRLWGPVWVTEGAECNIKLMCVRGVTKRPHAIQLDLGKMWERVPNSPRKLELAPLNLEMGEQLLLQRNLAGLTLYAKLDDLDGVVCGAWAQRTKNDATF